MRLLAGYGTETAEDPDADEPAPRADAGKLPKLDANHLKIPAVVAGKAYRQIGQFRLARLEIDFEELESMATLALVEAANEWDASLSPMGEAGYGSYLVQQTRWRLNRKITYRNAKKRRPDGRVIRLDARLPGESGEAKTYRDLLGKDDPVYRLLEGEDTIAAALAKLNPLDRLCVRRCWIEGEPRRVVADQLGVCQQRILQRLDRARLTLLRSSLCTARRRAPSWTGEQAADALARWRLEHPEEAARAQAENGRITGQRSRESAQVRRATGQVLRRCYYLRDDDARTLTGPYPGVLDALRDIGIIDPKPRGRCYLWLAQALGWKDIRPQEAEILNVLADGVPRTAAEISRQNVGTESSANSCLVRLRAAGLVEVVAQASKQAGLPGPGRNVYRITSHALACRTQPARAVPVIGSIAQSLAEEGYAVINRKGKD